MTRRITQPGTYIDDPDGVPARVVGPWVKRKSFYIDRAAAIFAVGMRNKWPRRCYIELFAGPGLSWDRGARRFVPGSALMAMEHPFTDYFFVDIDRTAVDALQRRASARQDGRALWVRQRDCNVATSEIAALIPKNAISLAFVDPTAAQIRFDAMERLARLPRVDLLFTFHVGAFRRAARTARAREIDAFFPPGSDWRAAMRLPREQQVPALLALYLAGLQRHGYRQDQSLWVPIRNRRNALMYVLVLFTKHPRGRDFWEKAIGDEDTGQRRLFDAL